MIWLEKYMQDSKIVCSSVPFKFLSKVNHFFNMVRNKLFRGYAKKRISPFSKFKSKNKCPKSVIKPNSSLLCSAQQHSMAYKNLAHLPKTAFSPWRSLENNLCDKINPSILCKNTDPSSKELVAPKATTSTPPGATGLLDVSSFLCLALHWALAGSSWTSLRVASSWCHYGVRDAPRSPQRGRWECSSCCLTTASSVLSQHTTARLLFACSLWETDFITAG